MQPVIVRGIKISRIAKDTFLNSSETFVALFMSSETFEKDLLLKTWKYFSFQ